MNSTNSKVFSSTNEQHSKTEATPSISRGDIGQQNHVQHTELFAHGGRQAEVPEDGAHGHESYPGLKGNHPVSMPKMSVEFVNDTSAFLHNKKARRLPKKIELKIVSKFSPTMPKERLVGGISKKKKKLQCHFLKAKQKLQTTTTKPFPIN
ncbi:hypothetical protein EUGRSUZ_K01170 [Eucalyptus grandis]|uniref:Uncharacterized protein n=2 Tax=Eucalyptus grandis TaxID=71139 RepID=A0ACC3ISS3_EUCGR|nr:hypothetical protein EUGRSUZ_K01170 [Eucalyptus grandis]